MRRRELLVGADAANGYEYVDLGLSVKWASEDVESSETDTPGYFQWGALTDGCEGYNYSSFYTLNMHSNQILTLPNSSDTANYIMGGGWRMPTETEFNELKTNTSYQAVNKSGFILRKNNKQLNFHYKGLCSYGDITNTNTCYLWSSTLDRGIPCCAYSSGFGLSVDSGDNDPIWGYNVRGVIEI